MRSVKIILGAVAIAAAFGGSANAACNVTQTGLVSHNEDDCASAADLMLLQAQTAVQQTEIDANTASNTAQDAKNVEQDGRLDDHDTDIQANADKNVEQDGRLDGHDTAIADNTDAIGDNADAIGVNSDLIGDNTSRIGTLEKGVAISMAMPDTWLSDKADFALAGNVGGFGDEVAVGLAAIARIDGGWSLNAKAGADTNFDEYGWSVGSRVEW